MDFTKIDFFELGYTDCHLLLATCPDDDMQFSQFLLSALCEAACKEIATKTCRRRRDGSRFISSDYSDVNFYRNGFEQRAREEP